MVTATRLRDDIDEILPGVIADLARGGRATAGAGA